MANPLAHRRPLRLEETLQVAYGDVVGDGDRLRRQRRVGQTGVDEGPDPQQQGPPRGVQRGGVPAEAFCGEGGEQVRHVSCKQFADLGAVRARLGRHLDSKGTTTAARP
ncbi:hypothetical protein [Streptomyces sp. HUAS ZL42]|uniref:hypothetical protein n=1 Tax=Streptomyces sp. HUAS ZL42 TaxID=3231715 RepID=UPI00345E9FED